MAKKAKSDKETEAEVKEKLDKREADIKKMKADAGSDDIKAQIKAVLDDPKIKKICEDEEEREKAEKEAAKKEKAEDKAADVRLAQIRKAMGLKDDDDSVRRADQHVAIKDLISTGLQDLDRILTPMVFGEKGKGGIPRGFVFEFFGPHAGGKSSLCMKLAANVTQNGGYVLWVDAEGSYVPEWAERHGVDNKRVEYVDSGETGEYYLQKIENVAKTGLVELIVIDSVTALTPKELLETQLEKEARVGAAAKMMTRALPRIISAAKQGNTAVIFINQIRMKVGVMYGNPETTPHGEALKFYASGRLRLSQVGSKSERGIMLGEEDIGIRTNVQIVKSRFGPPYRETIMPIYYTDVRPHPLDLIIDAALSTKVVKSRSHKVGGGSEIVQTFSFEDIKVDGIDEFKIALSNEHIKKMAELTKAQKVNFDPEIVTYLGTLDQQDPTTMTKSSKKVDPLESEEISA